MEWILNIGWSKLTKPNPHTCLLSPKDDVQRCCLCFRHWTTSELQSHSLQQIMMRKRRQRQAGRVRSQETMGGPEKMNHSWKEQLCFQVSWKTLHSQSQCHRSYRNCCTNTGDKVGSERAIWNWSYWFWWKLQQRTLTSWYRNRSYNQYWSAITFRVRGSKPKALAAPEIQTPEFSWKNHSISDGTGQRESPFPELLLLALSAV